MFFVLLLGTLITPALSGGSVNGDREAGTLATTQVTLVRTGALLLGKVLAAWMSSLALLVIALPFLAVAVIAGGLRVDTVLVSVLVVAIELGVVAAIGVGLSALLTRTVFSVVVTYLIVAALSLGTLLVFALGGLALQTDQLVHSRSLVDDTSSDRIQDAGLRPVRGLAPGRAPLRPGLVVAVREPLRRARGRGAGLLHARTARRRTCSAASRPVLGMRRSPRSRS